MPRPKGIPKSPNSGRKKGTLNTTTKQLKELVLGALNDVGGQGYLASQAIENPVAFMTLLGKVLPMTAAIDLSNSDGSLRPNLIQIVAKQ
jgi:hypothetical protein